jgi:hypothetical protein
MIRKKSESPEQIIIDLTGPEGNAFVLMRYAKHFAKQFGWDSKKYHEVIIDMMSGDYEHLLEVFDNHFGEYVILER